MRTFRNFLETTDGLILDAVDENAVKLHLTHLEELGIQYGKEGILRFQEQVYQMFRLLDGLDSKMEINSKWDGAPAIFFGEDPRPEYHGKFFVSTKSAFNTKNPIVSHSVEDIDNHYQDPLLAAKLKACYNNLIKVYDKSGRIFQGDVLFTREEDKEVKNIDGQLYITFTPNVITYAAPVDPRSALYNRIQAATVGVIVHDSFIPVSVNQGRAISTRPAGKKFEHLIEKGIDRNVFIEDSVHDTLNIRMDTEARSQAVKHIAAIKDCLDSFTDEFNEQYKNSNYLELLKIYMNHQIRNGKGGIFKAAVHQEQFDEDKFIKGFQHFVSERYNKESETKKTDAGKISTMQRRNTCIEFIEDHKFQFSNLVRCAYHMLLVKNLILSLLSSVDTKLGKAFITAEDGTLKPTGGEGFVMFVGSTANQAKLVDRLDFSVANLRRGKFQKT